MAEEETKSRGQPTKYQPEFCELARRLCEGGALDADLAKAFDVNLRTIYRWKAEHPEFCHAIKRSKYVADEAVERALFSRATGYSHDAMKIVVVDKTVVEVPYTEHFPPDTTAAIFWLKNRRPKEWRDKQEIEIEGKDGAPPTFNINFGKKPSDSG